MNTQPRPFQFVCHLVLSGLLVFTTTPGWAAPRDITSEEAADIQSRTEEARVGGRLTLGGRVGESQAEGYLDVLQPLVGGENAILFFNPKLSGSDNDEEEYSLGLGFRMRCPAVNAIAGVNAFYDSRDTRNGNTFDQVGAGVELLTTWVDARANYYWPDDKNELIESTSDTEVDRSTDYYLSDIYADGHELLQLQRIKTTTISTTRTYERFEAALEGYDAELGVRLPFLPNWMETRLFAGYYSFEGDFTEDINGMKGRLEIRALPALTLDAEVYEDDALTGSDYFFGARVNLPFDVVNLAQGKNPFSGTRDALQAQHRAFRDRLSEMVIRDPHVRVHESGFLENESLKQVDKEVDVDEDELVVMSDINFVNDRNGGFENGTDEHPFNTVQEGVDHVFGDRNVYVYQGLSSYRENVHIQTDGVHLLGEGKAITGYGGKTFGGGKFAVLDGNVGGVNGPVIRVTSDDVLIQGFEIARTAGGVDGGTTDGLGLAIDLSTAGIVGENANQFMVYDNIIHDQTYGLMLLTDAGGPGADPDYAAEIIDNTITSNQIGSYVQLDGGGSGSFDLLLEGNRMQGNTAYGLFVSAADYETGRLQIRQHQGQSNGVLNALLNIQTTKDHLLEISDSSFDGAPAQNFMATAISLTGRSDVVMRRVTMNNGSGGGLLTQISLVGSVSTLLEEVEVNGNSGFGFQYSGQASMGSSSLTIRDSEFAGNTGPGLFALSLGAAGANMLLDGVVASGNSGGVQLNVNSTNAGAAANLSVYNSSFSDGNGSALFVLSSGGDAIADIYNSEFSRNNSVGLQVAFSSVAEDASLLIRDSAFDDNLGGGLIVTAGSVGGDLDVVIDPTTASGNIGVGMLLSLSSQGNLSLLLEDVTANDNSSGLQVFGSSISGTVQAAFLDVEASGNSGMGLLATFSAVDDVYLVGGSTVPGPNAFPNSIVANSNAVGLIVSAYSASGQVISVFNRLEANGNTGGGGATLVLSGEETTVSLIGTVEANNNAGSGFVLSAQSASGTVINTLIDLQANNNLGHGADFQLNAQEDVTSLLGLSDLIYGFDLEAESFTLEAQGNQGGGINMMASSTEEDVLVIMGRTTASSNVQTGVGLTMIAQDDITVYMGLNTLSTNLVASPIVANDNGLNGVTVLANAGGSADFAIVQGEASRNAGHGVWVNAVAGGDATAVVGAMPLVSATGNLVAHDNGASGLSLDVTSVSNGVTMALADVSAHGNGAQGIVLTTSASNDAVVILGGFNLAGTMRASSNTLGGIAVTATAGRDLTFFTGGIEVNENGGNGLTANLTARDELRALLGIGTDGTNFSTSTVQANNNTGFGLSLLPGSASGTVEMVLADYQANSNTLGGVLMVAEAYSNLSVVAGELITDFVSNAVVGLGETVGNGGSGVRLVAESTQGSVTTVVAHLTSTGNGGPGAVGLGVYLVAAQDITADVRDSTLSGNIGPIGIGLDLAYTAGNNATITLEDLDIHNNAGGSYAQSFGAPAENALVVVRNVSATNNNGTALTLDASGVNSATLIVENVTANNNLQGFSLTAQASGRADLIISDVQASGNTGIGLDGDAIGGPASATIDGLTANGNGSLGARIEVWGGSSNATLVGTSLQLNNNGATGGTFIARGGTQALVNITAFVANSNTGHGVVVGTDGTLNGDATAQGTASGNSRYGVVAVSVGTDTYSAVTSNPGVGNGDGAQFTAGATSGTAEGLLP